MKCFLRDYSGFLEDQLRAEFKNKPLEDGFHLGYYSVGKSVKQEVLDEALILVQKRLNVITDIRELYEMQLPLKMEIPPPTIIGDMMVNFGINPIYPRRYSDWCVIQGTRYIDKGRIYWYDERKKSFTNEPRMLQNSRFK